MPTFFSAPTPASAALHGSDSELLRRLQAGDGAAFDTLYRRHQGPLFRFCLMRSSSSGIAAEVVQEVFIGLLTGTLRFDPLRGSLANFLFGVGRNLVMKHDRGHWPAAAGQEAESEMDERLCEDPTPLQRLLVNEQAEQVRRALASLPPHYRDVLILYELHDRSYLDIAAICQLDLGTVRSRLSRARATLASRLQAWRLADTGASA